MNWTPPNPPDDSREAQLRKVGHDIRNSLFVVRSGIQILRDSRDEADREILDMMDREHRRAGELLEELLRIAREIDEDDEVDGERGPTSD